VNTISWLHTRPDGLLKHPSYHVFKLVSNLARGEALDLHIKAPKVGTKQHGAVPALDVSASYDSETGQGAVFLVNRSLTDAVTTEFVWQDGQALQIEKAWQLTGNDPKQGNRWDAPEQVVAKAIPAPTVESGRATLHVPPLSFTVLTTCPL
jgi:alpha-N-arabinofuranosidase